MRQGIFAGLITGTMVSGLAVSGISLLAGVPDGQVKTAANLEQPEYSDSAQSAEQADIEVQAKAEERVIALSGVSSVPDGLNEISDAATRPAAQPDTDAPETAMAAPEQQDTLVPVTVTADSPVLAAPQAKAILEPGQEDALSVSTIPAQPLQPTDPIQDTAFPEEPETESNTSSTAEEAYDVARAVPESSGTITDIAAGVTTDRLPSITAPDTDGGTLGAAPEAEEAAFGVASDATILSPLERYSSDFENPDNKPLMAIVLVVDQVSALESQALEDFPYPVSFAIDVSNPEAEQLARRFRDAGHEVLAQIDLPSGADAKGTEEAMQIYLNAVPEAVAVIEGLNSGLQANRLASKQLAPILRDSGHGAVLLSNGLNTAQKLIAREGVPSASVFRDFDAQGQNERMIRRFLDQGAFRAGQEKEAVIMMGRLRPETAKALVVWALEDRAGRVALAPVSAVLKAQY